MDIEIEILLEEYKSNKFTSVDDYYNLLIELYSIMETKVN